MKDSQSLVIHYISGEWSGSCSVTSKSLRSHVLCSPRDSPGQNTGMGSLSLLQGIFPTQGSNRSPALQVDSLPAEPQGKPKNTGVSSLSLIQQIFSTQEWNQGLLHCRRILYQLSYQGGGIKNDLWVSRLDDWMDMRLLTKSGNIG